MNKTVAIFNGVLTGNLSGWLLKLGYGYGRTGVDSDYLQDYLIGLSGFDVLVLSLRDIDHAKNALDAAAQLDIPVLMVPGDGYTFDWASALKGIIGV